MRNDAVEGGVVVYKDEEYIEERRFKVLEDEVKMSMKTEERKTAQCHSVRSPCFMQFCCRKKLRTSFSFITKGTGSEDAGAVDVTGVVLFLSNPPQNSFIIRRIMANGI